MKILLTLEEHQVQALAMLAKRFGYRESIELSSTAEEAAHMMHAMYELQQQLGNQEQNQ
ncbi:MAG: hypothetical protein RPR91_03195 [Colwellia sp.]|jgi:hypothetical protein